MVRRVAAFSAFGILLVVGSVTSQARAAQVRGIDVTGALVSPTSGSLAGYSLPLRNIDTGEVVTRAVSGASGQFNYTAVPQGTYVVEARNAAGKLVGTSAPITAIEGKPIVPSALTLAIAPPPAQSSLVMAAASAPPVAAQIIYAAILAEIYAAANTGIDAGDAGRGRGRGRGNPSAFK